MRPLIKVLGVCVAFGSCVVASNFKVIPNSPCSSSLLPLSKLTEKQLRQIYFQMYSDTNYMEQGQLNQGEERLILHPNVWAQMGDLSYHGIEKLVAELGVADEDVFYDLGSGIGNVCMQVFCNTAAKKVVGVEFIPSRNQTALAAKSEAQKLFPKRFQENRLLEFCQGDIAEFTYSDATIVYSQNWMLGDHVNQKMAEIAASYNPNLKFLIVTRPVTSKDYTLRKTIQVKADWNDDLMLYLYHKSASTIAA